ncbi:MAG: hypothetical protein ABIS67_05090 [Candidatus Eisenbacteria bacterium]
MDQGPSGSLNCPTVQVVGSTTDANGVSTLRVVGHADHSVPATQGLLLRVFVDAVLIGQARIAILDQDGNGLSPSDLSLWLADYFSLANPSRSDHNGDAVVGPADLALWISAFFAGQSTQQGTAPTCP